MPPDPLIGLWQRDFVACLHCARVLHCGGVNFVLPQTGARASLASLPLHPHGCTYAYTRTGHVATAAWMAPHSSAVASRWRSSGVSDAAREPEGGRARLATTHPHAPHRCAPYQHSPPQETSLFVAPCVCVAMGLALGKVALLVADVTASRCFCVQVGITEGGLRELKKLPSHTHSLAHTHARTAVTTLAHQRVVRSTPQPPPPPQR